MERTKLVLAISPMVALVIAVAYLQGYWGYFNVLVFPYLSFSEILGYAAAPLFGFVLAYSAGMLFGAFNALDRPAKAHRPLRDLFDAIIGGTLCVLLIYFDSPYKWLVVPVVAIGLAANHYLEFESVRARVRTSPTLWLSGFVATTFIVGSFGWGRSEAQSLAQTKTPNVEVQLESEIVPLRFVGRLHAHYFFLQDSGELVQYPDAAVKRIVYQKAF